MPWWIVLHSYSGIIHIGGSDIAGSDIARSEAWQFWVIPLVGIRQHTERLSQKYYRVPSVANTHTYKAASTFCARNICSCLKAQHAVAQQVDVSMACCHVCCGTCNAYLDVVLSDWPLYNHLCTAGQDNTDTPPFDVAKADSITVPVFLNWYLSLWRCLLVSKIGLI